jgi:dGTPase
LKVLRYLEKRYEDFYGLNLSIEVLEGLQKHETVYDRRGAKEEFFPGMSPTMEAQVVNAADAIAFRTHDLEDALRLHIIRLEEVDQAGMELWRRTGERVAKMSDRVKATQRTRALIDMMIRDVLEETDKRVERNSIKSLGDVRVYKDALVSFSAGMQGHADALSRFLHENFYTNFRIVRMVNKGKRIIEELFRVYDEHPEILPPGLRSEIDKGKEEQSRVIADYIAGMTDRFAIEEHRRIFSIEHRA